MNASSRTSTAHAEKLGDLIVDKATSLSQMPRRGRMVPEVGDESLRELIVQKGYRLAPRAAGYCLSC